MVRNCSGEVKMTVVQKLREEDQEKRGVIERGIEGGNEREIEKGLGIGDGRSYMLGAVPTKI
jgi:hypothetical protein